jgi:multicomponent Na+:H+ antiporter subunit G
MSAAPLALLAEHGADSVGTAALIASGVLFWLGVVFLVISGFFFLAGAVGVIRFPDVFSRLHPAGKTDTGGLFFALFGIAALWLSEGFDLGHILTSLKVLFIAAFMILASPTGTHAIMKAGIKSGARVWTRSGSFSPSNISFEEPAPTHLPGEGPDDDDDDLDADTGADLGSVGDRT